MAAKSLRCRHCHCEYPLDILYECQHCGGILEVTYDYSKVPSSVLTADDGNAGSLWRYKELLPVNNEVNIVTLGEGATPLLRGRGLETEFNSKAQIYLKLDNLNPSGSFKDRPTSVGVSKAKEAGATTVIVSSSGNAAASTAAYAAKAGLQCVICIPSSTDARKVGQAIAYGAKVFFVEGPFSNAYQVVDLASKEFGWPNITSTFVNPYTVEGDKTVAYEIWSQLGDVPDYVTVPVGSGPLLVGAYKGFKELQQFGLTNRLPKMICVQAAQCSPIAQAFSQKVNKVEGWHAPVSTIASGIGDPLIGYEQDGLLTLETVLASGGSVLALGEEEIYKAYRLLANKEGVFAEPTGAISVAALTELKQIYSLNHTEKIVCLITGHGLKYVDSLAHTPRTINTYKDLAIFSKN